MAKPLGRKSSLIRDAIKAHPDMGNTELAEMINASPARKDDRIEVKPGDIAQQKQAMTKAGTAPPAANAARSGSRKTTARKAGRPHATAKANAAPAVPAGTAAAPGASGSPAELLDKVFDLARECGGVGTLKRLVDRIAELQGA